MEGRLGKQCLQHLMELHLCTTRAQPRRGSPEHSWVASVLGARIMEHDSRGRTSTQRDSTGLRDHSGSVWSTVRDPLPIRRTRG